MKKSIILLNRNFFVYNGKEFDMDKIDEINYQFRSNIKIILLQENLYAKKFNEKLKRHKLYEFVDYKINNEFPQNGDILYDFEIKNNIIAIYSIKGAKRVEDLSKKAASLEVKPIQFIINEIMIRVLKNKKFSAKVLVKFREYYYFMSFTQGLFDFGVVNEDKNKIINAIDEMCDLKEIYIDNSAAGILCSNNEVKRIELNLGELINEKIYEKQKFYSRKVLQKSRS